MPNQEFISNLTINNRSYKYFDINKVADVQTINRLPCSIKVLLENLVRHYDGEAVTRDDIAALANWDPHTKQAKEIAYNPARVILQDFTGVPAIVDLSIMRQAAGDKAHLVNPVRPTELVVDHSVQVDSFGKDSSVDYNTQLDYQRNDERYQFLKWAQGAFDNLKIVPPGVGIVHQVNLEYLARVVFNDNGLLYPDTLVGTDSHTTMANGLGVLAWGVGGIEGEAVMLGLATSMLIPQVIGVKLSGSLNAGVTATDLVLTITEKLRTYGVVSKFVEFCGDGIETLSLSDRATVANMAPEYGATCGFFPIDQESLDYLTLTNREPEHVAIIEAYCKAQGMFYNPDLADQVNYTDVIELDLSSIKPSIAGPKRPQDRILLTDVPESIRNKPKEVSNDIALNNGDIVIAAITSCTNTSNPGVILAAGLLAKNAVAKGLTIKEHVKTSLAPGSKTVTSYLEKAGCMDALEQLNFNLVGYGCTTCIGNSGPFSPAIAQAIDTDNLDVAAILSGNRNFEGRIHPQVQSSYLASPPLVMAYALHGRIDIDFTSTPIANDSNGNPVFLKDIWPTNEQIKQAIASSVTQEQYAQAYSDVYAGPTQWQSIQVNRDKIYQWQDDSTYIKKAPFCDDINTETNKVDTIAGAQVLALFSDSITTDHISPAGAIKADSPAGKYLLDKGIEHEHFNSYGSRRGNHEIMMRGTFANVRLNNLLVPDTQGGVTTHIPSNQVMPIYDAAMLYQQQNTPQIVLAGFEYGSGSSRDWAAKGPKLLGVEAVIAQSYERIHRANLVGMGILPLEFIAGESASSLGLTGHEQFTISDIDNGNAKQVNVIATLNDKRIEFQAKVRIDTPQEVDYYQNGGILPYIVKGL
jgi:aconitate hydratase